MFCLTINSKTEMLINNNTAAWNLEHHCEFQWSYAPGALKISCAYDNL